MRSIMIMTPISAYKYMYRYVGHVVSAVEKSYLTRFRDVNALARDEVHHSMCCLLDVPHLARLSRLCRSSRRLPTTGIVFVFQPKLPF